MAFKMFFFSRENRKLTHQGNIQGKFGTEERSKCEQEKKDHLKCKRSQRQTLNSIVSVPYKKKYITMAYHYFRF